MKDEEEHSFLGRFVEEFPAPLDEDSPLPVSPLSPKVSLEELDGESLEMGLKLLAARYQRTGPIRLTQDLLLKS